MTKEEIAELVAALPQGMDADEFIVKLVNWAVDIEREACAKVCEDIANKHARVHYPDLEAVADECSGEIRARGEK
jgi:hypothetical protein